MCGVLHWEEASVKSVSNCCCLHSEAAVFWLFITPLPPPPPPPLSHSWYTLYNAVRTICCTPPLDKFACAKKIKYWNAFSFIIRVNPNFDDVNKHHQKITATLSDDFFFSCLFLHVALLSFVTDRGSTSVWRRIHISPEVGHNSSFFSHKDILLVRQRTFWQRCMAGHEPATAVPSQDDGHCQ